MIKERIKKIDYKILIIFLLISLIFFGILINKEYSLDTYEVMEGRIKSEVYHFCSDGRFVTAFFILIVKLMNLSFEMIYAISYIMAICFLVLSLYYLNKIIEKDIKNQYMSILISVLIIINPFIFELFLFIEKGILILSIFLNIVALKFLIRFFENKKIFDLIITFIIAFFAMVSYQGTAGLFLVLAFIYTLKYSKNIKSFICNNIIVGLIYGISAVIDLIIMLQFKFDRVSGNINIADALAEIGKRTEIMFNTYKILPENFFGILLGIVLFIILICIIKKKETVSKKILDILKILYLIVGIYLITIIPQLIQDTESIWFMPRSTYVFASMIGILILHLLIENNIENIKFNRFINMILILISILLLAVEYKNVSSFLISRYKVNEYDREIAKKIVNYVVEYEKENKNINITKVEIYCDKYRTYTYENIRIWGDLNVSAFSEKWSTVSIIEYYLGRKLELVKEIDIEKKEYFEKQDWQKFEEEQLMIEKDTLIICLH